MAAIGDFDDDTDFPPWDHLPDQSRPARIYHAEGQTDRPGTGHRFVPKRHWCNLFQIVQCDGFGRYRCVVKDDFDMTSVVAFYPNGYEGFDFGTLKAGHTLAIMYAHQHFFADGTSGVRVENMDYVKVFPLSLQKFESLGSAYHKYGKTVAGQKKCNGCDRTAPVEELNRCGKCQQFSYCNRDCQVKAWNKENLSHKECCKVLRDPAFQALVKLDFTNYEAPFSFKAGVAAAPAAAS